MRQGILRRAGVGAAIVAGLAIVPSAQAAGRHAVPAGKPTKGATDHGATAKSQSVSVRVYLTPKGGEAALQDAVKAVADPSSSSYRQFLTPAQFRARFAPTDAQVADVTSFLKANGLKVTGTDSGARYVDATGTAAQAGAAFAATLHDYTKGSDSFYAPTSGASVPDSIAGRVLAVAGLSTAARVMKPAADKQPAGFRNARPCSSYYGEKRATDKPPFQGETLPYAPCGYQPKQFRSAYEGATPYTGKGVTVAITDAYASPSIQQDANTYATRHGDAAFRKGQLTQSTFSSGFKRQQACGPTGWYGEETLDVEAVHGMAPDANVAYYGAKSCFDNDLADTLRQVVDDNKASLVTNSWGEPESAESPEFVAAFEQVFQQGAMQGISFMFSSGDNGDEVANTGTKQADYPASDPWITSVGGTSTGIGPAGELQFQTGWGTEKYSLVNNAWSFVGYLYGAGGGYSAVFPRPSWQQGVVPTTRDSSHRALPDVAMDADPTTGMLVGETQEFPDGTYYDEYRIGGTSLASPLMAGFQALTVQRTGRQGYLNPKLYDAYKTSPSDYRDVATDGPDKGNVRSDYANGVDASGGLLYSVRTFDQDSSLDGDGKVKPGWDEITGLGSPSPQYLNTFGG